MAIASAGHVFAGMAKFDFGATILFQDVDKLRIYYSSGLPAKIQVTEAATLMTTGELVVRSQCALPLVVCSVHIWHTHGCLRHATTQNAATACYHAQTD